MPTVPRFILVLTAWIVVPILLWGYVVLPLARVGLEAIRTITPVIGG